MHISIPDPDTIALVAGTLGQISHIIKKRQEEKPEETRWQTVKRWVLGNPLNTIGAIAANGALIAACPVPAVDGWLQAVALFSTYFSSGMGCNSLINRQGPVEEGSVQAAIESRQHG